MSRILIGGRSVAFLAVATIALFLMCGLAPAFAYADAVDDVAAMIEALPANPTEYQPGDRARVDEIEAAFNALSSEDQAVLDNRCTHGQTGQSLGRVLEVAIWALRSYNAIDNVTTLPDGTYTASSTPALASEYSKGKSTSGRDRPWSVKSVTVENGKAMATIAVESDSYRGMWMGGVVYPAIKSGGTCEFKNVPVDLNSTFYFAGDSESMPIPIAFSLTTYIEEPAYTISHTVTFRDGYTEGEGGVLKTEQVVHGGSATEPDQPKRDGYVFSRWDPAFDSVNEDLTVSAVWHKEGVKYYWVTFVDDQGTTIDRIEVEHGSAVTPPAAPSRPGYTFVGWNPSALDSITSDLTVTGQWKSDDEVSADAVREKIAAIPADEKSLIGQTDNAVVTDAGVAYNAMTEDQRNLIDETDRLHLVRALIAVLPSDPFDINSDTQTLVSTPIKTAQAAWETLSKEQQDVLDEEKVIGSRTYGRYLESAVWGLDSLRSINDVTFLKDGTYSTGITSSSSRGKNSLKHDVTFTVKSVTVKDGHAVATIECSAQSYQTMFVGNKKYENTQTASGSKPQFEVPINLNSTFHFSVKSKSATEETEAVTFEMTVSANEGTMTPDSTQPSNPSGGNQPALPSNPQNTGGGGSTGGNAGNLSSLLTTNKSSGAASPTQEGASTENQTGSGAATVNKEESTTGARALIADSSTDEAMDGVSTDLMPAVSGGTLFGLSLGCLGFALRFVRRESLSA